MAINFPTSLDTLSNPNTTDQLNSPSHAGQHSDINDAVEALEAKVGADSSAVESSHDYKLSTVTGSNKAETQANKRTSFQATPTDTAYPSEKLVKDSLDAKYGSGSSPTFATVTTTGDIELGNASDTTLSRSAGGVLAVEGVVIPSISSTNTLTNKRITPRVTSETSSATPTINTDNSDAHSITALATDITSMTTNLSGTPTNFQKLIIRFKDNGTARAITWGASFEDAGQALPTTTVISKLLTVGFIYNTVTSKWGCVAVANET